MQRCTWLRKLHFIVALINLVIRYFSLRKCKLVWDLLHWTRFFSYHFNWMILRFYEAAIVPTPRSYYCAKGFCLSLYFFMDWSILMCIKNENGCFCSPVMQKRFPQQQIVYKGATTMRNRLTHLVLLQCSCYGNRYRWRGGLTVSAISQKAPPLCYYHSTKTGFSLLFCFSKQKNFSFKVKCDKMIVVLAITYKTF